MKQCWMIWRFTKRRGTEYFTLSGRWSNDYREAFNYTKEEAANADATMFGGSVICVTPMEVISAQM
jgi:hypothetical protein